MVMDSQGADDQVVIEVSPGVEEWGSKNDRWQKDLFTLRERLDRQLPRGSVQRPTPAEGAMGLELTEVLLTLGSSGAISGAVEVLKVWLREKKKVRTLRITVRHGDGESQLVVDSENIDSHDLAAIAQGMTGKR